MRPKDRKPKEEEQVLPPLPPIENAYHALAKAKAAHARTPHLWEEATEATDVFVSTIMKAIEAKKGSE